MGGALRTALLSVVCIVACTAACNSIVGFDDLQRVVPDGVNTPEGGLTGGDDDDLPRDGAAPTKRCDPSKDFGAPALVSELDGTDETRRAIMTLDELEIFYLRGDRGPYDLRHAIRPAPDSAWGAPVTEPLTPPATELGSLAVDGKKLYYWSLIDPGGTSAPTATSVVATRDQPQTPFGAGTPLGASSDRPVVVPNTDDGAYYSFAVTPDGGTTEEIIYRASVLDTQILNGAQVPGLHVAGAQDDHPALGANELIIYFASQRPGSGGDTDIFRASRASKQDAFDAPLHMSSISSPTQEAPSWVSTDDCEILLDRSKHVYLAKRGGAGN